MNASFLKRASQNIHFKFQKGNVEHFKDVSIQNDTRQQILTQSSSSTFQVHFFSSKSNENKEIKIDGVKVEINKSTANTNTDNTNDEPDSSKPKLKKTEKRQIEDEAKKHFKKTRTNHPCL